MGASFDGQSNIVTVPVSRHKTDGLRRSYYTLQVQPVYPTFKSQVKGLTPPTPVRNLFIIKNKYVRPCGQFLTNLHKVMSVMVPVYENK